MKKFICHNGFKISQSYSSHLEGFDIMFNKKGEPIFECRLCKTRYNLSALKKRCKEINQ